MPEMTSFRSAQSNGSKSWSPMKRATGTANRRATADHSAVEKRTGHDGKKRKACFRGALWGTCRHRIDRIERGSQILIMFTDLR